MRGLKVRNSDALTNQFERLPASNSICNFLTQKRIYGKERERDKKKKKNR